MKKTLLVFIFYMLIFLVTANGQELIWTKKLPDSLTTVKTMRMDTAGNFYILGNYTSNTPFLTKLNSQVELEWTIPFTSVSGNVYCNAIEIDKLGNICTAGSFSDILIIDTSYQFNTTAPTSGFIAKFNSNGDFVSCQTIGQAGTLSVQDIAFDNNNVMYITGGFSDTLIIDSLTYTTPFPTTYLAKYNNENLSWFKYSQGQYGSTNTSKGEHIAVNEDKDILIHIGGYGHLLFDSTDTYFGCLSTGEALAGFDSMGNISFLSQIACWTYVKDIISCTGDFLTAGEYSYHDSHAQVYQCNITGSYLPLNTLSFAKGNSTCIDTENNYYITGKSYSAYTPNPSPDKLYIIKNSPDSSNHWQLDIPDTQYSEGLYITYNNGFLYTLGKFKGTLLTPDSLVAAQPEGYFIAKIKDTVVAIITNSEFKKSSSCFSIYPNPTTGIVNMDYTSITTVTLQLTITNALGIKVHSESFTKPQKQLAIDISKMARGVYFIELMTGGKKEVRKIILN